MSTATAENFAGFNWVFALWDSAALTIIAATEPLFMVLHQFSTALIVVVGFAWFFLIALRVREGIAGVLVGGLLIFALVLPYLMRPAAVQLPSGATVQMVEAQALTLKFVMSAHKIFQSLIKPVLDTHSAAGTIVPAQAAIDDIVGRSADVFAGSDLAQLIRDYNASCVPHTNNLTGPRACHQGRSAAFHWTARRGRTGHSRSGNWSHCPSAYGSLCLLGICVQWLGHVSPGRR